MTKESLFSKTIDSEQFPKLVKYLDGNQIKTTYSDLAFKIAERILVLAGVTIVASFIKRSPHYQFPSSSISNEQSCHEAEIRIAEDNTQHMYMLSIVCLELCQDFPLLDPTKVLYYCLTHDLIEIETGDEKTFNMSDQRYNEKEENEIAAISNLRMKLTQFVFEQANQYLSQDDSEALFVRLVDKLLPDAVNIVSGTGTRVMNEYFGIQRHDELVLAQRQMNERLQRMFEHKWMNPIHEARELLANIFASRFEDSGQNPLF